MKKKTQKIKKGKVNTKIGSEKVFALDWDNLHKKTIKEIKKCVHKSKIPNVQDDILRAIDKEFVYHIKDAYSEFFQNLDEIVSEHICCEYTLNEIVSKADEVDD